MNKELVSVIIPTYNRANVIERAIRSVLNQTYDNIEIIIVDDKSEDNTKEIVDKIDDNRIRYFFLEENKGACFARNYGIEISNGKYIAFQDSDDEWINNKLEKQIQFLEKNKLDVVSCKMIVNNSFDMQIFPKLCDVNKKNIYFENYISTQTILGKKVCFIEEEFDEKLPRFQDWELIIRLVSKFKVKILDEILVNVYIQENSISKNSNKAVDAMEIFLNKHSVSKDIEAHYLRLQGIYKVNTSRNYKENFRKAFIKNPYNIKHIFDYFICIIGLRKFHYNFYRKRNMYK